MMQVIPQTHDEKIAMYMKLTKRELAEMLVNANAMLDRMPKLQPPTSVTIPTFPNTTWMQDTLRGAQVRKRLIGDGGSAG